MKAYRQGDISIITAAKLPGRMRRGKGEPILARGELTGHAHRIVQKSSATLPAGRSSVPARAIELRQAYHEEHEDVVLPKGDYEIRRQREFDWVSQGVRNVTD
jgi:hypothetical protein